MEYSQHVPHRRIVCHEDCSVTTTLTWSSNKERAKLTTFKCRQLSFQQASYEICFRSPLQERLFFCPPGPLRSLLHVPSMQQGLSMHGIIPTKDVSISPVTRHADLGELCDGMLAAAK